MTLAFKRAMNEATLLDDALQTWLCISHELLNYGLQLQCAPEIFAVFACPGLSEETRKNVEAAVRKEWSLVLSLEQSTEGQQILGTCCPFTRFQPYRELCSCLEVHGSNCRENSPSELEALVEAYFPRIAYSANTEQIFQHLEDAVRRSQKPDIGSLSNLFACSLRAMKNRICATSDAENVELLPSDFESKATRALKPKLWSPSSALPCVLV